MIQNQRPEREQISPNSSVTNTSPLTDAPNLDRDSTLPVSDKYAGRPTTYDGNIVRFRLLVHTETFLHHELQSLLGPRDTSLLMDDWRGRCDFRTKAPGTYEFVLLLDSNDKARHKGHALTAQETTQDDQLASIGCVFANDQLATLLCAQTLSRATRAGINCARSPEHWEQFAGEIWNSIPQPDRELLTRLRAGGVRVESGILQISANGRLCASRSHLGSGGKHPSRWALGMPS